MKTSKVATKNSQKNSYASSSKEQSQIIKEGEELVMREDTLVTACSKKVVAETNEEHEEGTRSYAVNEREKHTETKTNGDSDMDEIQKEADTAIGTWKNEPLRSTGSEKNGDQCSSSSSLPTYIIEQEGINLVVELNMRQDKLEINSKKRRYW